MKPDTSDYGREMIERGRYLTEVIDKMDGLATYEDIENIPEGRQIINFGPSCFTGDTRIMTLDSGRVHTLEELYNNQTKDIGVYSSESRPRKLSNAIRCSVADSVHLSGYTSELLEVEIDNVHRIRCTPGHEFLLRNGSYRKASDLLELDELMPITRELAPEGSGIRSGREQCFNENNRMFITHIESGNYHRFKNPALWEKSINHHVDKNSYNNHPFNIECMTSEDHRAIHTDTLLDSDRSREYARIRWSDDEYRERMRKVSRINGKQSRMVNELNRSNEFQLGNRRGKLLSHLNRMILEFGIESITTDNFDELSYKIESKYHATLRGVAKSYECIVDDGKPFRYATIDYDNLISIWNIILEDASRYNHKVTRVTKLVLDEPVPVYDLVEVDMYHNYALALTDDTGVFVHNCGKTTAIRQFVVKHIDDYGIIATKLVKDVNSLVYDINSQLAYLGIPIRATGYYSGDAGEVELEVLRTKTWIVCTHERLNIEPASILFTKSVLTHSMLIGDDSIYRKYLFIDEYPDKLYKEFKVKDTTMVTLLDSYIGITDVDKSSHREISRMQYISAFYSDQATRPIDVSILNSLPTPTSQSYSRDVSRGLSSTSSLRSMLRLIYFTNLVGEKLATMYRKHGTFVLNDINDPSRGGRYVTDEDSDLPEAVYYSVKDYLCKNVFIFDGTGDILFKDSSYWGMVSDPRFNRKLTLSKPITKMKTYVDRLASSKDIAKEYVDLITQVANLHPSEKILAYMWKSSNDRDSKSIIQDVMKRLDKSVADRLSVITYMSGNERVTSDYMDHTVCMVLGKFFIPNSAIDMINKVNNTKISSKDYTISLIIQFLYRSAARLNKPVSMYITNDYDDYFINELIGMFDSINLKTISDEVIAPGVVYMRDSTKELRARLRSSDNLEITDEYVVLSSHQVRDVLGLDSSNIRDLKERLSNSGIEFDYEKGKPSKFIIK